MVVWKDKAYLFIGSLYDHAFDLKTEKWFMPYSSVGPLIAFCTVLLGDKMYVFGGEDHGRPLGTDQTSLWLSISSTNSWEHLSGTIEGVPTVEEPKVRTLPSMWAAPNERKIYVMYGSANRTIAAVKHAAAGNIDYAYDEFWSYDVASKKWERERLRGNYPSPRTEAASAYCNSVGATVIYDGYHDSMQTTVETHCDMKKGNSGFTFFGDTFLFDTKTRNWRHVLVRGFPSYRSMSTLVSDPDTGKIYYYLFGDFIPSKALLGRLKIDTEGEWTSEDLLRDLRSEKMGPWMRCFSCRKCGITWQQCAGSCGRKVLLLFGGLSKAGWKEHKDKFRCTKIQALMTSTIKIFN
ncbi:hypothetical protein BT96DRAFT_1077328 [Gymnopus androsaceus JB14]|uniref:Galactose oxidase n=1 Tax=Gymnopus androsaceus JB14 TaxID=1447944 RepID=A0A6A4IH31_9AGAR|nr:hypothetical protein BT96DRAFT_1077328 [Gymnopus androsaceus JB14]